MTNLITLDLGGTTCKASIVEDGRFTRSTEYEVGAGIHMASRLRKGNGYVLRIPSIDIAEIGAGGGSLVSVDSGGLLTVGPRSAGADPGPACYGRGGTEPALTDCYLVLGYLNPDHLLGGAFRLQPERARAALGGVAARVGMDPVEAAWGAYRIANSNMGRAIHAVSSERGRDPRKFVSLVFGGAGPLHAAAVAGNLGMAQAIIAPHAGVFSAFGFCCADIERTRVRGAVRPWSPGVLPEVERLFAELAGEALRTSADWGFAEGEVAIERSVDLRYLRQASELTVALPAGPLTAGVLAAARRSFDAEHEKTFGHSFPDAGAEMVSVRMVSRIMRPRPPLDAEAPGRGRARVPVRPAAPGRTAYFGPRTGFVDTPVVADLVMGAPPMPGPLLVDRYDTTVVVPTGCTVAAAAGGALVIDIPTGGPHA